MTQKAIPEYMREAYQEGFKDGKAGAPTRYTRKYFYYDQYKAGHTVGTNLRERREAVKEHVSFIKGVVKFFKSLFK